VIHKAVFALAIVSVSTVVHAEPLTMPKSEPCEPQAGLTVLDFSMPVPSLFITEGHSSVLEALQDKFKITTIFRYYDDPPTTTVPGKPLRKLESDALLAAHFKIGVVFQHHNDQQDKFLQPGVGSTDAETALTLADENKQPYNTTIYFGVDGPFELPAQRKKVLRDKVHEYFQDIAKAFDKYSNEHGKNKYHIGMYCSADMCDIADDLNLKYVWLSPSQRNSPDFGPAYKKLLTDPKRVNLVQYPETTCSMWGGGPLRKDDKTGTMKEITPNFDFNQVNSENPDLGTWDHKRQ
jgi:hypothetical protein